MTPRTDDVHAFIRSKPRPTRADALHFARSVMMKQRVYSAAQMATCGSALAALVEHAVDLSEFMAAAMLEYAMEGAE